MALNQKNNWKLQLAKKCQFIFILFLTEKQNCDHIESRSKSIQKLRSSSQQKNGMTEHKEEKEKQNFFLQLREDR